MAVYIVNFTIEIAEFKFKPTANKSHDSTLFDSTDVGTTSDH
jgi:hypothetical protein